MTTLTSYKKTFSSEPKNAKRASQVGNSRDIIVPRMKGDDITQISQEIEERGSEKISLEFSWNENRIIF